MTDHALPEDAAPQPVERGFYALTESDIAAIVRRCGCASEQIARVRYPEQGVNNQTYIIEIAQQPDLVVKVRPGSTDARPLPATRDNPYWPHYTQDLFGPYPNGDIATLPSIVAQLEAHGSLRVPRVYLDDISLELIPAPFLVSERLAGRAFEWSGHTFTSRAAHQLGAHLARLHRETQGPAFGIYARRDDFAAAQWWPRFTMAFHTLLDKLCAGSALMRQARPSMEPLLRHAVASGTPQGFSLVCIDQSPTHYLSSEAGAITGMIDVEAHLWAPREYELSMIELWVSDRDALREGYGSAGEWPEAMEQVRAAFQMMTWMEWAYCSRTLLHDAAGALELEERIAREVQVLE